MLRRWSFLSVSFGCVLGLVASAMARDDECAYVARKQEASTGQFAAPSDAGTPEDGAVPAPRRIQPIVRRLVGRGVTHESCETLRSVRGEERYLCWYTDCRGCHATRVEVTLGVRDGQGRVLRRRRIEQGDTGACGNCGGW